MALYPFTKLDDTNENFKLLERFTVEVYDKNCDFESVYEYAARKDLFCHKSISMEKLPPTQDALLQHSKRAAYQAGIYGVPVSTVYSMFLIRKTGDGF